MIFKILRLFVNTLTAAGKYSLFNRDNLTQPIHMQLSQEQKTFFNFFSALLKSTLTLDNFRKKYDPHNWYVSDIMISKKRG